MYIISMTPAFQNTSIGRNIILLLVGILVGVGSANTLAQNGPPPWPAFEKYAPQIGETFPDVTIHDDLGNPVNLRELADENYKVLVLGCLT